MILIIQISSLKTQNFILKRLIIIHHIITTVIIKDILNLMIMIFGNKVIINFMNSFNNGTILYLNRLEVKVLKKTLVFIYFFKVQIRSNIALVKKNIVVNLLIIIYIFMLDLMIIVLINL